MASKDHKIVRKAQALSELTRLSGLIAEQLQIQVPDPQVTNRDAELAEIQRIENINALLTDVLEATKPVAEAETANESAKKQEDAETVDFSSMTKDELIQYGNEHGIGVTKFQSKTEIIETLKA